MVWRVERCALLVTGTQNQQLPNRSTHWLLDVARPPLDARWSGGRRYRAGQHAALPGELARRFTGGWAEGKGVDARAQAEIKSSTTRVEAPWLPIRHGGSIPPGSIEVKQANTRVCVFGMTTPCPPLGGATGVVEVPRQPTLRLHATGQAARVP